MNQKRCCAVSNSAGAFAVINRKNIKEALEQLVQAGRYTATAKNNQDCHFIFVQNDLERLKEIVWQYIDELEEKRRTEHSKENCFHMLFLIEGEKRIPRMIICSEMLR